MIEGRHFRSSEARRRTLSEAIDRYTLEEIPKKKDGNMHRAYLPWWKENLGNLKLAEITPATLSEYRQKLALEPYSRANPKAKRTSLKKGEEARVFKRSPATINRYLSTLSHVFTVARKDWQWTAYNPFENVSRLREGDGRIRYVTEEERTRFFKETAKDPILHTLWVRLFWAT